MFKRSVTLYDNGAAEATVRRIIASADGGAQVSYREAFKDAQRGTVTYELLGPPGPLERVYNWGVSDRAW